MSGHHRRLRCLLPAAGGVAQGLGFLVPELFFLVWVAFVPVLVTTAGRGWRTAGVHGLIFGLFAYGTGAHWILHFFEELGPIDLPLSLLPALLFWALCALAPASLFGLFALASRRMSPLLAFPLLTALVYAWFPMLVPTQLGSSQSAFLIGIQPVRFVGTAGLDAMIGLVNVTFATLLLKKLGQREAAAVMGAAAVWFGAGGWQLWAEERRTSGAPHLMVGIVQPNEPVRPGDLRPGPPPGFVHSRAAAAAGAELIVWPETRSAGYFRDERMARAFSDLAREASVPILFQDIAPGRSGASNAAVLLSANGQPLGRYDKIRLMPIGERLPVIDRWPAFADQVRDAIDDTFPRIEPGDGSVALTAPTPVGSVRLLPLICYETLFPAAAANAARTGDTTLPALLVGMSSDGWFGQGAGPRQHVRASILRAVETGLPFVQVLNNGPSMVVGPTGRILSRTPANIAGAFVVEVPIPPARQSSVHSRSAPFVPGLFVLLLVLGIAWGSFRRRSVVMVGTKKARP